MLTMTLLSISALLKAVFAGIAMAVAFRFRFPRTPAEIAWIWVASALLVSAVSGVFQGVWAALAFSAGSGTGVFDAYLLWMPAMNYSRFGIMIVLGAGLAALPFLSFRPWFATFSWPLLISGIMLLPGLVAGVAEGGFVSGLHHSRLSVLQVVETLALMTALFVAVLRRSMDSWLWLALSIYALRQAVNSLLWAGNAWNALPGAWHPPFWLDSAIGVVVWTVMIVLAGYRLKLARRGASAPMIFAIADDGANAPISTGIDLSRR